MFTVLVRLAKPRNQDSSPAYSGPSKPVNIPLLGPAEKTSSIAAGGTARRLAGFNLILSVICQEAGR